MKKNNNAKAIFINKHLRKQKSINSETYAWAKTLLHPAVRITDAYVYGKWLCLQLSSNVRFIIKNNI